MCLDEVLLNKVLESTDDIVERIKTSVLYAKVLEKSIGSSTVDSMSSSTSLLPDLTELVQQEKSSMIDFAKAQMAIEAASYVKHKQ